jgi:hypothetical protein
LRNEIRLPASFLDEALAEIRTARNEMDVAVDLILTIAHNVMMN